jgi:hypothetical protein
MAFDWEALLAHIEHGRVVPVIGPDLLEVGPQNGRVLYYGEVAQRFAKALGVNAGAASDLADVLARVPASAPIDPHEWLRVALTDKAQKVPEALEQLADIASTAPRMRLFLSTTPDDLLFRALQGKVPAVGSYVYAPQSASLPSPEALDTLEKPGEVMVVRLFGQPAARQLAITEEEVLEQIHGLQIELSEGGELQKLGALLRGSDLLFLGCGFPDWLMRFFIRALRGQRFHAPNAAPARIAETDARQKTHLVTFLEQHGVDVYGGTPADFVRTLRGMWQDRVPAPAAVAGNAPLVLLAHGDRDERVAPFEKLLEEWRVPYDHVRWPGAGPMDVRVLLKDAAAYVAFMPPGAPDDRLCAEWREVQRRWALSRPCPLATVRVEERAGPSRLNELESFKKARLRTNAADVVRDLGMMLLSARLLPRVPVPVRLHCLHDAKDDAHAESFQNQLLAFIEKFPGWLALTTGMHITPGSDSERERLKRIDDARVIVLLQSTDLINKHPTEVERVRSRVAAVRVFLVRVRATARDLDDLDAMALPAGGEPMTKQPDPEQAWADTVRAIVDEILRTVLI